MQPPGFTGGGGGGGGGWAGGIIGAIASLGNIFGGGITDVVRLTARIVSQTLNKVAEALYNLAHAIGRVLGKVLTALHDAWVRVIWPLLRQLPRVIQRLRRLIERDLPRLLRLIERIRERILELYERWVRPILLVIERIRRMLLIFRLLRMKWAEDLDRRLRGVEEQIMRPLAIVLKHLALVEQWINVIVSAEQLLQETIFGNSLWRWRRDVLRTWVALFARPLDPLAKLDLFPRQAAVSPEESREHMRLYLQHNSGPIAADVAQATAETRRQLGV